MSARKTRPQLHSQIRKLQTDADKFDALMHKALKDQQSKYEKEIAEREQRIEHLLKCIKDMAPRCIPFAWPTLSFEPLAIQSVNIVRPKPGEGRPTATLVFIGVDRTPHHHLKENMTAQNMCAADPAKPRTDEDIPF